MTRYTYYPGCTLYTKARNLDLCARKAAEKVGFELVEMPSWNCCGAIYNAASDDLAAQVGPLRNLAKASQLGDKLVTLCAACHNVLKRVADRLSQPGNEVERDRLVAFVDEKFERPVKVLHYLEVLKNEIGWDKVKEKITKPLAGLKVASYYGCLMVRPKDVLEFGDTENPQVMDDLMRVLGAVPTRFDFKTECCGGYLVVNRRDVAKSASKKILDNAKAWGAEAIVTTCPLCQYNLDKLRVMTDGSIPVFYFTQLLGVAVGLTQDELGLEHNAGDPAGFLKAKGLL
ncbi:MAG: CoB--CoM heterodisulfide reductase iron-sulfur subunit B family protein [candidate division WOR-3 bacterium]|nr:CoB--CoM heterodisulfide reductase iron-sulfur subunit B family protein [candidate division WOR-3 bacterium]